MQWKLKSFGWAQSGRAWSPSGTGPPYPCNDSLSYTRKVTSWTDPFRCLNTILPEGNKWVSTACLFNLSPRPSPLDGEKASENILNFFPPMHLPFWVICICSMIRLFIKFLIKKFFLKEVHHELWNTYFHLPHLKTWSAMIKHLCSEHLSFSEEQSIEIYWSVWRVNNIVECGICNSVHWADGKTFRGL